MYLLERIMGCAVYCVLLLVVCNGVFVSKPASVRRWLVFYALAFAVLGFVYVPPETADLYRLTEYMHGWASLTPSQLVERCAQSSTPAYIAYFWVIGQFGVDGLLPASAALIYHLLVFSCLWDYARREGISTKNVAYALAFIMSFGSFLQVISGIRSYLAFAIVVRCIYRETVCGRPLVVSLPGYVAACLMHPAALAFVGLRLVILVFQKEVFRGQRLLSIALMVMVGVFAARYGSLYIDSALDKFDSYFSGDTYRYLWEYLIHGVLAAVLVGSLYRARKWISSESGERNLVLIIVLVLLVSLVAAPFEYAVFLRFTGAAANLSAPLVMSNLQDFGEDKSDARYRQWLTLAILLMLFLACTRGDLCGYKFMEL